MIHRFGDYELDTAQRKLRIKGQLQAIEPQVLHLLAVLIENGNRVVTRDELIDAVWQGRLVSDSTLASRIKSVRQAIGDNGERQDLIQTVYGSGYRFVGQSTHDAMEPDEPEAPGGSSPQLEPPLATPLATPALNLPVATRFDATVNRLRKIIPHPIETHHLKWLGALLIIIVIGVSGGLWRFLPRAAAPTSMAKTSIAVLPFMDMSAASDQEYFADGVAEEILNALAKVTGLRVVGRTSSFSFKGQNVDVKTIGKRLNAEAVLEGSIRRSKDRVRVTTQLVDTKSGYHLWSETYDQKMQDIFAIQDNIARAVVKRLNLVLRDIDPERPLVTRGTRDPEAYRLYLKGRYFWKRRYDDSLPRAINLFQEAIERDANFGRAHSALAATYVLLPGYSHKANRAESHASAERSARTALTLVPELSEPYAVLGWLYSRRLEWRRAEQWFRRAISRESIDPVTHLWYGAHSKQVGRLKQALAQYEKALEIDPAWGVVVYNYSQILYGLGHRETAIKEAQQAVALDYRYAYLLLRNIAFEMGDLDQAAQHYHNYLRQRGYSEDRIQKSLKRYEVNVGITGSQSDFLQQTEQLFQSGQLSTQAAFYRFYLAKKVDRAIELFDPTEEPNLIHWLHKIWLPYGHPLRTHPQFAAIAKRLDLIPYWREFGWPEHCSPDPQHGIRCD